MFIKSFVWILFVITTSILAQTEIIVEKITSIKGEFQDIVINENRLFALNNNFINVYDIENSLSPIFLTKYDFKIKAQKIAIYKNYLYIGDGEKGAVFLDINDINDIYIKLSYTDKNHNPYGVVVENNISYQADGINGINIVDITDPYNAYIISNFKNKLKNARDVAIKNNLLYVADGEEGLKIINVENKYHPYLINSFRISGFANDIKIRNNIAFIADAEKGVETIDVSNPFGVFKIPNNFSKENVYAIDFKNDYMYVVKKSKIEIFKIKVNVNQTNIENEEFLIKTIYSKLLYRKADIGGLNYWILQLKKGKSVVEIVESFLESKEFNENKIGNKEFINILYKIFLGREVDPAGLKYWYNKMKKGISKKSIFYEFAFSNEFKKNIEEKYKIIPYTAKDKLRAFIERLYNILLEREIDAKGKNYWTKFINNENKSLQNLILSFFNSLEFKNRNLTNEQFIKVVYEALLGREPNKNELKFWIDKLKHKMNKLNIIKSFLKQKEFKKVINEFIE